MITPVPAVGVDEFASLYETATEAGLAWSGAPVKISGRARYWEPGTDRPDDWLGGAFVAALKAKGVDVQPHDPKAPLVLVRSKLAVASTAV